MFYLLLLQLIDKEENAKIKGALKFKHEYYIRNIIPIEDGNKCIII